MIIPLALFQLANFSNQIHFVLLRVLLMSDTHGTFDERMHKYCKDANEIWHAGDWGQGVHEQLIETGKTIRGVYGNIDDAKLRVLYPETLLWNVQGLRFFMTHIGGKPGRLPAKAIRALQQSDAGFFICGHSHILNVGHDNITGALCLNPGAAGIHGFHKVRTMLRFSISEGKISDLAAIELGPRAAIKV